MYKFSFHLRFSLSAGNPTIKTEWAISLLSDFYYGIISFVNCLLHKVTHPQSDSTTVHENSCNVTHFSQILQLPGFLSATTTTTSLGATTSAPDISGTKFPAVTRSSFRSTSFRHAESRPRTNRKPDSPIRLIIPELDPLTSTSPSDALTPASAPSTASETGTSSSRWKRGWQNIFFDPADASAWR